MSTPRFQELTIKRINTEGGGSVAVTLDIPPALREIYRFEPGQFLTLRATVNGEEVRRHPPRRFCGWLRHYAHFVDFGDHAGRAARVQIYAGAGQPPHV